MKSWLIAIIMISTLIISSMITGCSLSGSSSNSTTNVTETIIKSESDNGSQVYLVIGEDTLLVRLRSNPSTGNTWNYLDNNDLIKLVKQEYISDTTSNTVTHASQEVIRTVGEPGTDLFYFTPNDTDGLENEKWLIINLTDSSENVIDQFKLKVVTLKLME